MKWYVKALIYLTDYPPRIINRAKWLLYKNELKSIGKNSHVGPGFSISGAQYISIGDNFSAGENLDLHVFYEKGEKRKISPELVIGDNVTITNNCYISCLEKVEIGTGVLLGSNVFITDNFHGNTVSCDYDIPPANRELYSKGPVRIGDNVWIGRNVCVMPGVTVGDGAIIGANSVVTHNIPDRCIGAGTPARIIADSKHSI